ncbi:ferredoxin [Actinoplanes sp. NPDC051411]|uniref:ferredoxin n=1 Tax=Actinoplanes sp. NPDC051411 TaxID=3155522 RepID=UPI0034138056
MPFFVTGACLDVLDKSCIEECPVDCIYEGGRKMYINPRECIDCGACEAVCPVTAISSDLPLAESDRPWRDDNVAFFETVLPGRSEPLGSPGGASDLGRIDADAPLAASS